MRRLWENEGVKTEDTFGRVWNNIFFYGVTTTRPEGCIGGYVWGYSPDEKFNPDSFQAYKILVSVQ